MTSDKAIYNETYCDMSVLRFANFHLDRCGAWWDTAPENVRKFVSFLIYLTCTVLADPSGSSGCEEVYRRWDDLQRSLEIDNNIIWYTVKVPISVPQKSCLCAVANVSCSAYVFVCCRLRWTIGLMRWEWWDLFISLTLRERRTDGRSERRTNGNCYSIHVCIQCPALMLNPFSAS